MEDGTGVGGPVQEKFEENLGEEVKGHFHSKFEWEEGVMIVKQQKHFTYTVGRLSLDDALHALQEKLEIERVVDRSPTFLDALE